MHIKFFDTRFEAKEYARLHVWEIVYCSEFSEFLVYVVDEDPYMAFLYHTVYSVPGSPEFDIEFSKFFEYLSLNFDFSSF